MAPREIELLKQQQQKDVLQAKGLKGGQDTGGQVSILLKSSLHSSVHVVDLLNEVQEMMFQKELTIQNRIRIQNKSFFPRDRESLGENKTRWSAKKISAMGGGPVTGDVHFPSLPVE